MTREETIIQRLNTLEKQLKRNIIKGSTIKALTLESEIKGMRIALMMLGYQIEVETEKAENIDGTWIDTYTGLIDLR